MSPDDLAVGQNPRGVNGGVDIEEGRYGCCHARVGLHCCVCGFGASGALAGEVTGNGKETPIGAAPETDPHASSICSFLGQNDDPEEPGAEGRTQSWQTSRR